MMASAQVVETSGNVTSNSPSQVYTHPYDHNLPNYEKLFVDGIGNRCNQFGVGYRFITITDVNRH